ncbi:GH25 family lysozyme [Fructilactobacillus frigidiflavus]|uniref:GH25 family lysozyme n=1 Tax=Fructilactobacillus frigidiflavus TaxID=3242688 RepID=UPI0037580F38
MRKLNRTLYQQQQRQNRTQKYMILGCFAILILLIGFLIFNHIEKKAQHQQQVLTEYPVRGLIINQDDSYVDFTEANQNGMKYAYLRATQGASFVDDNFNDNYSRSIGSGLKIGVYHQFGFGSSVKDQEKNFSEAVGNNIGDLPIEIRISYYGNYNTQTVKPQQLLANVRELTSFLYRKYHRPILLKTNQRNYQILKNLPHVQFALAGNDQSDQVTFVNLSKANQIDNNGKISEYQVSAFNGNKVKWEQYLKQLKSDELEKSNEND